MTPQDPQPPQNPPMPPNQGMPSQPQQPNPPYQPGRPPGPPPTPGQPGPGRPPGPPPTQGQPNPARPPVQGQPGPGPQPPLQGAPGQNGPAPVPTGMVGQPNPNRPDYQWQPAAPPPGTAAPGGAGTSATASKPSGQGLNAFLAAIRPEPAKAPPLEWVGLVACVVLIICGFLPWINLSSGESLSGIDGSVGDGWIVAGAGLVAAIMGFLGLSRDSIALAAGQALIGLIVLGFAIFNVTRLANGEGAAFGLILTIVIAVIVIILGLYNAFDAFRKGAKY